MLFAATSVGEAHAFGRIFGPRFRACRVLKENYVANIYIKYRDRLERLLGEFAEVQPAEPIVLDQTDLAALPSTIGGQVLASNSGRNQDIRGMQGIGSGVVGAMGISASPWLRTVPFDSEGLTVQV